MPANTNPIFSAKGSMQWIPANLLAANTAVDGTGTVALVFTGNATGNNAGSLLKRVIVRSLGTNVATVMRFFINNGLTNVTAANNQLVGEITIPATTINQVAAQPSAEWYFGEVVPAGYRIYATIGTAVAAGFAVTGVGGDY
jgi:hypothetical protein